ncbi:MAG: S49 family peptidase [Chloroflexota bacterium]|nr:S49 family peptidase [Chloroflexota bacterium]
MGSPFRDMTEEKRELWRGILDQVYEDFVRVVADSRGLSREAVRELADGSIYTGQQAKNMGLVDGVGTRQAAIDKAAELGGIVGEPRVIELTPQPSLLEMFYGLQARSTIPALEELVGWSGIPSLQFRLPRQ